MEENEGKSGLGRRGRKPKAGGAKKYQKRSTGRMETAVVAEEDPLESFSSVPDIRVSLFDYSVENHCKTIETISSYCGMVEETNSESSVINRFSSAVTFLEVWKDFSYKHKTIRFSCEIGRPPGEICSDEVTLPQFSSATVPELKRLSGGTSSLTSSKNFVLHVGGSIWALDWCPRVHQRPGQYIKCEYLAIAAHPPEASYHKIGVPVTGRGLIQIWCILNVGMSEELSLLETKGTGLKRPKQSGSLDGQVPATSQDAPVGTAIIDNGAETELRHKVVHTNFTEVNSTYSVSNDLVLPRLVMGLAHNGRVAWDAKWRPCNINGSKDRHRMGYLAVLLGNGSLEVWEVPFPSTITTLYASYHKDGTDPRFVKLEPVFKCSKLKRGDHQSIPLIVEWSTSAPHDQLLAGFHDGTVALWKFSAKAATQDTRPLLFFTADNVPIRALSWAPAERGEETANLIVTGGHEGLRFWDIRDPYRPLWDLNPLRKAVYSVDWLQDPQCLLLAFDDGTLRILSMQEAANDAPVTGKTFGGSHQQGLHYYCHSTFTIWSVNVSHLTGIAAYCVSDGSTFYFKLPRKAVEKGVARHRAPVFLCGSLTEEGSTLTIKIPVFAIPLSMKKSSTELKETTRPMQIKSANLQTPALHVKKDRCKNRADSNKEILGESRVGENGAEKLKSKIEVLPPKIVAMHRVRWNLNKGSERWLGYGGAAGIIRCQEINL